MKPAKREETGIRRERRRFAAAGLPESRSGLRDGATAIRQKSQPSLRDDTTGAPARRVASRQARDRPRCFRRHRDRPARMRTAPTASAETDHQPDHRPSLASELAANSRLPGRKLSGRFGSNSRSPSSRLPATRPMLPAVLPHHGNSSRRPRRAATGDSGRYSRAEPYNSEAHPPHSRRTAGPERESAPEAAGKRRSPPTAATVEDESPMGSPPEFASSQANRSNRRGQSSAPA